MRDLWDIRLKRRFALFIQDLCENQNLKVRVWTTLFDLKEDENVYSKEVICL